MNTLHVLNLNFLPSLSIGSLLIDSQFYTFNVLLEEKNITCRDPPQWEEGTVICDPPAPEGRGDGNWNIGDKCDFICPPSKLHKILPLE